MMPCLCLNRTAGVVHERLMNPCHVVTPPVESESGVGLHDVAVRCRALPVQGEPVSEHFTFALHASCWRA